MNGAQSICALFTLLGFARRPLSRPDQNGAVRKLSGSGWPNTTLPFQLNNIFMIRAEAGFLGPGTQVLAGRKYRFGL